ncbi:MAG: Ger(x)C family spore germination protein [Eubacterium sp.]|nr:Ger(x)C family spore germination protein [Eubacterium sp.]
MKNFKIFKIIVCIALICSVFSGCMHQTNLKNLIVIEGIGIDNAEDGVQLTVQSLNPGKSTGVEKPEGNMTINTVEKGTTIVEAISNLNKAMSKELFFGHNKIIVFSREICETDLNNKLDYFLRSSDARADVAVCMADGDAKKVLENSEDGAHVPVENMVYLIGNGQKMGTSIYITTNDLLNLYADKTTDMYLPVLKERADQDNVELSGIAVFSDDKLSYVLDEEETLGFMLMSGKIKNCYLEIHDEDLGNIGIEVIPTKIKKKVDIVDGGVVFKVDVNGHLMINEVEKGIANVLKEEHLKMICSKAEEKISYLCSRAFSACQEHDSDSIRVGEYLAKDSPESYELLSDDWNKYFKTVSLSVKSDINLKKISDNTQIE